jgi:CRP-like cAMP-binding protein
VTFAQTCMENIEDTSDLLQVLGYIVPLPEPFQLRMASQVLTETHKSGGILLWPGETSRRIYYIKQGFLRAYTIDDRGRECTSWFMGQRDVMISVYSFFTQRPAEEYIQVLQDSVLQSITYMQLNSFYADFKEGNQVGRVLTEKYYILSEERAIHMRTKSAQERYEILLSQHPDIEQVTNTSNIASYLGIPRETFSRMRSAMLKHKP